MDRVFGPFDYGPAPVPVKVDRAHAQAGLDPKNLGDVGKLSRNIPTARYTEIEKKVRVLAADLKE